MITAEMRAHMRRLVLVDVIKIETVAPRFGVHHSVIRRTLRDPASAATPAALRPSKLEHWKPSIVRRLTELPLLASARLFMELRDRGSPAAPSICAATSPRFGSRPDDLHVP